MAEYFNYWVDWPDGYWGRAGWLRKWWRIFAEDPRWVPPPWLHLRHALLSGRFAHLQRCQPRFVVIEALPRRRRTRASHQPFQALNEGVLLEQPVAAAVLLTDPRRRDYTAHLALLHTANSRESLERLLFAVQETVERQGIRRLLLPVGLSPHLGTGVLQDHFHRTPPLHAPYAPPYTPELLTTVCRPLGRALLFASETPRRPSSPPAGPARIRPLDPQRLATDLLPLFVQALPQWADFPPVDEAEAQFLLWWILRRPALAWLAELDEQPVGFLLAQPDTSPALHRSKGGRTLLRRLQLRLLEQVPSRSVRLFFLGVDEKFRRRGIGRQLWQQLLAAGPEGGWQRVTVGPLPTSAGAGLSFLGALGMPSRESYLLHRYEF